MILLDGHLSIQTNYAPGPLNFVTFGRLFMLRPDIIIHVGRIPSNVISGMGETLPILVGSRATLNPKRVSVPPPY